MTTYTGPDSSRASLASSRATGVPRSDSSTGPTYRAMRLPSFTSPAGPRPAGSPPLIIADGQEYYWTDEWREGERETLAELAAGRGQIFASADEALRFLFEAEPD